MTQCSEPSVDDMLNDPIVRALMASDGVDLEELQRLLRSIAENLRVRRVEDPQERNVTTDRRQKIRGAKKAR
jgi:hypothetical protein